MVNDELLERGHDPSMKEDFNRDLKPTTSSPAKKVRDSNVFVSGVQLLDLSVFLSICSLFADS